MVKVICISEYDLPYEYQNYPAYLVGNIYDADLNWCKKEGNPDTICIYNESKEEAYLETGNHFDKYFKIDIKETRKEKLKKLNEKF